MTGVRATPQNRAKSSHDGFTGGSIERAMRYRQGTPTNAAKDIAIKVLAEMVLERSGGEQFCRHAETARKGVQRLGVTQLPRKV